MEPFLQIAPHSLAIVLSRVVAKDAPGVTESEEPPHHHTGYEIFADFKSLNMKYFWNKMVADAIAETFFLGWIDEHVLLIQGKEDHLEVLREAWMRRSLKPPQGFDIKYLGDVSPISMSPISQSQFIPLGEILCLAISAMNSARKTVTQETLIEHLATCFPGVPTPSMEILRHTLNMLVRERKIYPTPEGYFIVTQQTYFITPSLIRTNSKWYHLDERIPDRMQQQQPCTSPHSGTMTPSTSGCVRERTHHKNHSDSYNNSYREEIPSTHTSTLQKRSKEHKESSPVSPPPQQPSEKSKNTLSFPFKTETNSKNKDGSSSNGEKQSKKFGLKLFRLSFKKDKTKHVATFSAQFPPEEWPLRDEEMPTTVPREVEMEIIRRINPDLTVENLARHTAVMKRLEEEKAQRNKANSSAQQSARSKRSRSHRKTQQGKASRSHSKTRASRGDPSEGSNLDISYDRDYKFYSSSLVRSPRETMMSMERNRGKYMVHSNPNIVESHFTTAPEWDVSGELAKRRTEMPFPEPSRAQSHSKVHRSHSHTQERKSRNERSDKAKERSRSMDNSKGPLGGPYLGCPEDFECSPDDRSRYYTDDGTLRASAQATHYSRIMLSAARLHSDVCVPDVGRGSSEDAVLYRTLEKSKSRDSLPAYNDLKSCSPKAAVDDYFQCTAANEAALSAPSPLLKPSYDFTDSVWKGISSDRQTPHLTPPHSMEYKEETTKGQSSIPIAVTSQTPEPLPNGRLSHQHNPDSGDLDTMPEVYSQETLLKPQEYIESSFSRLGTIGRSPHTKSAEVLENQEHFDKPLPLTVPPSSAQEQASCAETTFDYYNVSDDDSEETSHKNRVDGKVHEEGGTMQWLLEREKERDLQRKFEKNLTFLSPKEGESNNSQKSVHSTRLDSMDSSSVTVDSGFNSPRTRESLASNTSSNVENSRRQNMALSPGHIGTKRPPPPYQPPSFRTIREPPANRTEKQASITSV
ncbi:storkhead-box protein 2-like isoform X1 [Myxocyprinus asiaticus]|uniref:storkhead-box protein 2-like isoform X1 n=2 Tax=Myxocyprinus asiaticus TaxID=70543 RepID=UPI002222CAB4|nr:storkhead-box protein 2-like isoform X1 [Myxocyprinus asiaticus]